MLTPALKGPELKDARSNPGATDEVARANGFELELADQPIEETLERLRGLAVETAVDLRSLSGW